MLIFNGVRNIQFILLYLFNLFLIIRGEPRIGKTRLLDEIAQNIPTNISYDYISLVMSDVKVDKIFLLLFCSIYVISKTHKRCKNIPLSYSN